MLTHKEYACLRLKSSVLCWTMLLGESDLDTAGCFAGSTPGFHTLDVSSNYHLLILITENISRQWQACPRRWICPCFENHCTERFLSIFLILLYPITQITGPYSARRTFLHYEVAAQGIFLHFCLSTIEFTAI